MLALGMDNTMVVFMETEVDLVDNQVITRIQGFRRARLRHDEGIGSRNIMSTMKVLSLHLHDERQILYLLLLRDGQRKHQRLPNQRNQKKISSILETNHLQLHQT